MPHQPAQFREKLLVVDFVAFDKQRTEFFFDATFEQACEYIWSKLCPTAHILFAWQYGVVEPVQIKIKKAKLTDDELNKKYKGL